MTPENEIVNVDGTGLGLYMTSALSTTSTMIPTIPTITISYEKRKATTDLAMPISPAILKSVCQPLVPQSTWSALTGKEFYIPSSVQELAKTGIRTASSEAEDYIDWKPDKATTKLLELESTHPGALKEAVLSKDGNEGQILVFMGKFKEQGHGSDLPVVKTRSILPLSPRDFCNLLMDSSRVKSYNKMSLGRHDKVVFQKGVDTSEGGLFGPGETKIVRNLTKPPLTKKTIEFVTLMHARPLTSQDQVGPGILGGTGTLMMDNHDDTEESDRNSPSGSSGYIVVSRAIPGGDWNSEGDGDLTRSEILLGVNLVRPVPGHPNKSEVTAVTHVHSPSIPTMLAGTVGVKGAIDFVRDIRSLQN
jgi:hypothetical protein